LRLQPAADFAQLQPVAPAFDLIIGPAQVFQKLLPVQAYPVTTALATAALFILTKQTRAELWLLPVTTGQLRPGYPQFTHGTTGQ